MIIDWIRHTRLSIEPGLCYGQTDVMVADTFEEEAANVVLAIKDRNYDAVFTSPLVRAKTLASYCGYPDAIEDDRLKELNFGEWEMKSWLELFSLDELQSVSWFSEWHKKKIPGGESLDEMMARVRDFIREQCSKPFDRIACFCHGGTINCAQVIAGAIEYDDVYKLNPDYGEVVTLNHQLETLK